MNATPTPVSTVRHDLPAWVEDIITRSLAKAPVERFQSAAEFHEGFARCLAGLPLASMYAGVMEPGMTPPRAMPTGSFPRPMPTPPMPTPYQMTGQMTASNMTVLAPGTNPGAIASSSDTTVLTPAMGQETARMPGTMPPAAITPPAEAPPPSQAAALAPSARSASSGSMMWMWLGGGVAVLALVGIGYAMFGRGSGAPPPAPTSTSTTAQTAVTTPAPAEPAATPGATSARATGPASTPTSVGPSPAARGSGNASADAKLATFPNVKFFAVLNGKRTNDRDVALNFLNGQVIVMPRQGGQPIATVPYRKILKATHSLGRDPKWDQSLPGPPAGLDVGTFMRQSRHWFVVQGAESYAVLRLDDSNFRQILQTFERRTGQKVITIR